MEVRKISLAAAALAAALSAPCAVLAQARSSGSHPAFSSLRVSVGDTSLGGIPTVIEGGQTDVAVWNLMQVLNQLGFSASWSNGVLTIAGPVSVPVNTTPGPQVKGGAQVVLDGTPIERIPSAVATPPGASSPEAFIPIANAVDLFARLGIAATLNGNSLILDTSALPAPLPGDEIAVWNVVSALATDLGLSPAPSGASPYSDLSARSPAWGIMQAAIRAGWYQPPSSSMSGAFQPITWAEAAQLLWNALGISEQDAAYQPGGSPTAWASAIGLVPDNWNPSSDMTAQELGVLASNLHDCLQGYVETSPTAWRIWYPPADEYEATLQAGSGQTLFASASDAQAAILATYQFFNQLQVVRRNSQWLLVMPSVPQGFGFANVTSPGGVKYQVGGGKTWISASSLDTRDVRASASEPIAIQIPPGGIVITWNQMMPALGGTVALGALDVQAGSSGLAVERVNVLTPNLPSPITSVSG